MATQARTDSADLSTIRLLGSMCFDRNPSLAQQADQALYQKIIIPLCDDFSSQGVHVVNRILAALIQQTANCIDSASRQALDRENLHGEEDLLKRLQRIQRNPALPSKQQKRIKKICILSRVTIGADISITSIIIQRLHDHFPTLPITLIGPDHVPQLFNWPFLRHKRFDFKKDHRISRLSHWVELQEIIDGERDLLDDDQFLCIDPDTRLSQLGLLPLAPEHSTRVLPSRLDQTSNDSLARITNSWLDCLLQTTAYNHPAFAIATTLPPAPDKPFTIAINFGVGRDQNKRISLQFEQELISQLLRQENIRVILDSGVGDEEVCQAKAIEDYIKQQSLLTDSPGAFLRLEDSVASLAGHIRQADLFIGYDSCSGHIAAACNTPTIICFKGSPNPRFYARWQPENRCGRTSCLEVPQKQLNDTQRSLLIQRIIDIASSHYQSMH